MLIAEGPQLADIVRFKAPTTVTISFASPVYNLFMGFVSLNANQVYNFTSDFEILSQATRGFNRGYWGFGLAERVDVGGIYQLREVLGEPHGMLLFPVSKLLIK